MIPVDYPRPRLYRASWRSLNGPWEFDFFDNDFLITQEERIRLPLGQNIEVPFAYQTRASGIDDQRFHKRVIYRREVTLDEIESTRRVRLHIGAADYHTQVWINGLKAGEHSGGYTPFAVDIPASAVAEKRFVIAIIVTDDLSGEQPRGKQAPGAPFACWYTPVTGIWQEVWLEFLPELAIENVRSLPQTGKTLHFDINLTTPAPEYEIEAEILLDEKIVARDRISARYPVTLCSIQIDNPQRWSPERPTIYFARFTLKLNGAVIDTIETYTAFRTLEVNTEGLLINGKSCFQSLVLMQGYYGEGGYTPPSPKRFQEDIKTAKRMGFNGCRMHMKFEDPRFYYAADRLGFLVWEEAPAFLSFSEGSRSAFLRMWIEILQQNSHHPSIVTRVLCNESWGIREISASSEMRFWLREIFAAVKQIDPSRPLISNDGWEHLSSDLITFHSYEHDPSSLTTEWNRARQNQPCGIEKKQVWLEGSLPARLPWLLSEFGGISFLRGNDSGPSWGYEEIPADIDSFRTLFTALMAHITKLDGISGWCYTQFSDVEQEKNGLLFDDGTPKLDPDWIREQITKARKD